MDEWQRQLALVMRDPARRAALASAFGGGERDPAPPKSMVGPVEDDATQVDDGDGESYQHARPLPLWPEGS